MGTVDLFNHVGLFPLVRFLITDHLTQLADMSKKGLLERLNAGEIVVGDGGFVFSLEKRGYCKAGPWTPEAVIEHPEAVKSLHREFLRAGSDVMQTFTFYASEDKLENRGHYAAERFGVSDINRTACKIVSKSSISKTSISKSISISIVGISLSISLSFRLSLSLTLAIVSQSRVSKSVISTTSIS